MSQNSTISIAFKMEGDANGFKKLTLDADGFRKIISETIKESEKLKSSVINFAAVATGIDSISKSVNDVQAVLKDLATAHAAQIEAETKLAVNMRNTMSAREEDIQSIKKLCAAQQDLGVIGDEVQLAGAQELATYLSEKQSLEKLIPVMNDMLAQQYGLNATQENAANIATMLGKVMDGQTGALSRYGYSFDAVQEQILKYGTEAQRAAVLCDVVSSSVGGMNAELAKTDDGKQKQLENTIGDLKEQLGGLIQGALPFVTISANTMLALAGTLKFVAGVKAATTAIVGWNVKQKALNALLIVGTGNIKKATQAINIYSTAAKGSAASTLVLKTALRGFLITTGIGAAVAALTAVIVHFANSTDKATDSTKKFLNAEERAKRDAEQLEQLRKQEASTLTNTRAALEININKLREFNGTKEQEKKIVGEMNDTYGHTMGYFSSVADWYKALISNSEDYCRQMTIEARTRMLANQIAEKEQETHDIAYDDTGKARKYSKVRQVEQYVSGYYTPTSGGGGGGPQPIYSQREIVGSSDWEKANAAIEANNQAVANLREQMKSAAAEAADINFSVRGSGTRPDGKTNTKAVSPKWNEDAANLKEIEGNIKILQDQLQTASIEEAALINKQIVLWQSKADAIRKAGKVTENNIPIFNENADNLKGIRDNIKALQSQLETATIEEAALINQQIQSWQDKADAISNAGKAVDKNKPIFRENATTLAEITENIGALSDQLNTATIEEAALINQQIKAWEKKADAIRNAGDAVKANFDTFRDGWNGIKNVGSGIDGITDSLEGNGNAWQKVTGIVDGFLQIYDGIKTIVGIIDMLTMATGAQTTAETAKAVAVGASAGAQTAEATTAEAAAAAQAPVIAANKLATASFMELAAASYFAAHAYIPFAGFGIASGFVSASAAIVNGIGAMMLTPFADGGIVSGPTVGLIGEYAGASNNPEVVAPLDKLRRLLQPVEGMSGGVVKFRIDGRTLVGILEKENNLKHRS